MTKFCDFGDLRLGRWPAPDELRRYFFAPGKEWLQDDQDDGAIPLEQDAYGTENPPRGKGLVNISLKLWGKPELGVLLI